MSATPAPAGGPQATPGRIHAPLQPAHGTATPCPVDGCRHSYTGPGGLCHHVRDFRRRRPNDASHNTAPGTPLRQVIEEDPGLAAIIFCVSCHWPRTSRSNSARCSCGPSESRPPAAHATPLPPPHPHTQAEQIAGMLSSIAQLGISGVGSFLQLPRPAPTDIPHCLLPEIRDDLHLLIRNVLAYPDDPRPLCLLYLYPTTVLQDDPSGRRGRAKVQNIRRHRSL